jgi:hypothetical protein
MKAAAHLQLGAPLFYGIDEKPFIGQMFQLVAAAHQIPKSRSYLSTATQ